MKLLLSLNNHKRFPVVIHLNNRRYFIIQKEDAFVLLNSICPHQGGEIELNKQHQDPQGCHFICPVHGWKFDHSGQCTNVKNKHLEAYPLIQKGNNLYLDESLLATAPAVTPTISTLDSHTDIEIKLHAHACVEIITDGFSILTDPWLLGPAFMGSWIQYPQPRVDIETLKPDIICITHEHSDHFHPHTLKHLNPSTPVFFPAYPNQRIEKTLTAIGFNNLFPIKFGDKLPIAAGKGYLCPYEPVSTWNDSIVHININGFNILNYNDAGLNYTIKKHLPKKIDLLMGQFSVGASGYPLTWKHLSIEAKREFYKKSRQGIIQLMSKAFDFYQTATLLPFASFFMLGHPFHLKYRKELLINTLLDIEKSFAAQDKSLISLMPGESYSYRHGYKKIYTQEEKAVLYHPATIEACVKKCFNPEIFATFHYSQLTIQLEQIITYFKNFNNVPELCHCDDIIVNFFITQDYTHQKVLHDFSLHIIEHVLTTQETVSTKSGLNCWIPVNVLAAIIQHELSWDEAHIGYWCEFERTTDTYEASFWRLLQSPYYNKPLNLPNTAPNHNSINLQTSITTILEKVTNSERVLARYGLYCFTCDKAYKESLHHAIEYHGLTHERKNQLIKELNVLIQ